MQPALMILKSKGAELGLTKPLEMFWATGALSSFLDNTPTYLVFLTTAGTLGATTGVATTVGTVAVKMLMAISCGAVFMGANTYIGNAPNFMVKSISDENGIKMPSFFGYMLYLRSAYSYLCYIPDFGRVRSIYPNAAAPHKPPFDMTEFGLIDTIRDMFAAIPRNGFDGIGDDCTVFPLGSGESLVFTADLLAENIHFLRRATSARELGRKSLAVNLSDVAAMGARPIATLLSLAIPHDLPEGWIEDFMEGYRDLSAQYDVGLVGGDTTASDSGLVVNVTAIGRVADSHIKRRSDARPGDLIAVGGSLGESGAGLRDILAGRYDTPLAQIHRNPAPQVAEGIWLGERPEVHAMMDISDGIASDLRHILHRSGVGAEVDTECIPTPVDLETAVSGGEDYKLLFTVAPESADTLLSDYRLRFGDGFHFIGRITGDNRLEWLRNGTPLPVDWQGFRHY